MVVIRHSVSKEVTLPEGSPKGDPAIIAKLVGVESNIEDMSREIDHLYASVKSLYSSILALSSIAPTIAATLYLNRTDIIAQYHSETLLVWPCVVLDSWNVTSTPGCTLYIPTGYVTEGHENVGYINPTDNRVQSTPGALLAHARPTGCHPGP